MTSRTSVEAYQQLLELLGAIQAPTTEAPPKDLRNAIGRVQRLLDTTKQNNPAPDTSSHMDVIEHILKYVIKPIFRSSPHPSLNLSTGRKLSRMAGGPLASQDLYEAQAWKEYPGVPNIVSWCVKNMQVRVLRYISVKNTERCGYNEDDHYERLWHLIIPPVMTLLDDYEASYKLSGISTVSQMLECVPKDLLLRTGIDGVLSQSLATSLTYLHSPETPDLLRTAVPTMLSLIKLTTSPGSAQRFDRLCDLLDDGIIGGVWMYMPDDPGCMLASLDVLPSIICTLGIGSVRYLKVSTTSRGSMVSLYLGKSRR
jgi:hypothetical protein